MKVLLGFTGTVATLLVDKIVAEFKKYGHEVKCICTERAKAFLSSSFSENYDKMCSEKNEWEWIGSEGRLTSLYRKGYSVLHIELAKWCDVMCIIADANTIGKMVYGISDNLLVSAYLALPPDKKKVIAPAMNTNMWFSRPVQRNVKILKEDGCAFVDVDYKELACGDKGYGALAPIFEIVATCDTSRFMFGYIPTGDHPGAFGVKRRHHNHTGVDLYVHRDNVLVYPFEDGEIVGGGHFTGIYCNSPWWNNTHYLAIKHGDIVIVYGEILLNGVSAGSPVHGVPIGKQVTTQDTIGSIVPVTKNRHPEYKYHNNKMLHVEMYKAENFVDAKVDEWEIDKKQPDSLLDPTEYLLKRFKEQK